MVSQIGIAIFGVMAVYLSQHRDTKLQRYASVFGLIGQPFWFYAAYQSAQWGIFVLCILYTMSWGQGFYNHWIRQC